MAWTASSLFTQWPKSVLGHGQTAAVLPAAYLGLTTDSVKVAPEIRITKKEADHEVLEGYRSDLMELQKRLAAASRESVELHARAQCTELQRLEVEALRKAHHDLEQEKHVLALRLTDADVRLSLAAIQISASCQARFDAEEYVRQIDVEHQAPTRPRTHAHITRMQANHEVTREKRAVFTSAHLLELTTHILIGARIARLGGQPESSETLQETIRA